MLLDINPGTGIPIYRQIADQVRREIVSGRLRAGEQVTSVRELAAALKVNPMTVSKAYSELDREGLVENRRGIGLFVARVRDRDKKDARRELLEGLFKEAASAACQFDMSEAEAVALFREWYKRFSSGR